MQTEKAFPLAILRVTLAFLALTFAAPAQQSHVFTKVLDLSTQRTDGGGPFTITSATTPAFDGQWVVFRDNGANDDGSLQSIWSFNTKDGTLHKLVDLHTLMPGGTATFTELHLSDTAPAVRNGTVVFLGRSTSTGLALEGLYSVPAAGGGVSTVADYRTADPSGGVFTLFDVSGLQTGGFSFDGTTVAFRGQGSGFAVGIYTANPNGSALSLMADSLHPYTAVGGSSVPVFSVPLVSGGNVVMGGTDGASPAKGYNGLYAGKAGNNGAVTELVNSAQQLPGGTNAGFHTRFDAPYMAFDGTMVAFHASDSAAPAASPFSGLYWTDLTSHAINKIADVNSTLSGLGKLNSMGQGVAVSQGNVLFRAADGTGGYPGNNALYLWANGTATRIAGTGDKMGGNTVQVVHDPGPSALSGTGFAFLVEFGTGSFAIYYATPAGSGAGTVNSFSAASYAVNGQLAASSIASAFGQGLADTETVAGVFPLPTTLANVTLNVKDSAGTTRPASLYYAGPTQINYVVPDGTTTGAGSVTVAKSGQTVATGTIQVAAVAPGLFTANGDGKGAAAALALNATASGAQTWLNAVACGATAGSCVTAPIDLGAATDQVFLVLFGTGIRGYKTSIAATIGGTVATPAFFVQPQYPGMDQVNVLLDRSLAGRGEVDVVLTVDGVAANTVKINVK